MKVSLKWLSEYTAVPEDLKAFCDRLDLTGTGVEGVEKTGEAFEGVVVGHVLTCEPHPDSDHMHVVTVDVGAEEPVQIVCGAPNIAADIKVPVALVGAVLPGDFKIKKSKLRGVVSCGMCCSKRELGLGQDHTGIWVLPEDAPVGQSMADFMSAGDTVLDLEITPNRPDCLSMVGMAREAAATFGERLNYPDTACQEETEKKAADFIQVEIREPELCRRYAARIVTDVKIGQSPWWLQKRLMYAGMRPINNIVDITNFVMLEFGQPIHAFDIRQIADSKIIVERAAEGEKFTTLDNTERTLTDDMLLIKDGKRGVAIAGVMGGLNSEIEADTTTILVESANFNGDSVRATSKKLGLRTEASSRFEKGIDPNLCQAAADRVCRLIEILGCGKVATGTVDVYPKEFEAKPIDVRVDRVNKVLGIELPASEMIRIFESLEMKVEGDGPILKVTPPTVRQDMISEVDFIEEVARMYGYDNLPVTLPKGNQESGKSRERALMDLARDTLCALGLNEVQTYSFVSPKGVDQVRIDEDSWERAFVKILNPLGEENSVMRTILTPNMLEVMGRNYSRKIENVKAFEIGSTFMANLMDPEQLPDEMTGLCIGLYGEGTTFFTLKGILTELLKILGIRDITFVSESEYGVYHPGRCARIRVGEEELGIMGEVYPDVAEEFGIGTRAYVCELFFDAIIRHANVEKHYEPLPKYPSTSRDIALLVDEDVQVGDIEKVIREKGRPILESVKLFDVYRGKQVAEGKKSAAFALTYRDKNKTLTDEEVAKVHESVLEALKNEVNATLREM